MLSLLFCGRLPFPLLTSFSCSVYCLSFHQESHLLLHLSQFFSFRRFNCFSCLNWLALASIKCSRHCQNLHSSPMNHVGPFKRSLLNSFIVCSACPIICSWDWVLGISLHQTFSINTWLAQWCNGSHEGRIGPGNLISCFCKSVQIPLWFSRWGRELEVELNHMSTSFYSWWFSHCKEWKHAAGNIMNYCYPNWGFQTAFLL